uniref:Putative terpene synthase 10 n=1 Tax=Eremophila drummondii TaxID=2652523 RepID=A0A6G9KSS1_9LAMI|nr:putative terpene synthase 10 [Eremophila drummondii]
MAAFISVLQCGPKEILQLPLKDHGHWNKYQSKQHKFRGLCHRVPMAAATTGDRSKNILRDMKGGQRQSLWTDIPLSFDAQGQERHAEAVQPLKEEVRRTITATHSKPKDKMMLIDALERLGIAHYFEQEIEEQIEQIFKFHAGDGLIESDLFTTALYFRLFRQHGYDIPSSVFNKFKDKDNKFSKNIINDIEGLLSLYEASYLRYHGENILDEAMALTKHHLTQAKPELASCLREKVSWALDQPIHRVTEFLEARYYISIYEKEGSKNEQLLKLAKLNFNILQSSYKKELADLLKWWNDLNSKLPYLRDRLVGCYFWAVGIAFEPQYSSSRLAVAKSIAMMMVINDTYDSSYASLEELFLFTETVKGWNVKEIEKLPEYLKVAYSFLLRAYEDQDREVSKQGRHYAVSYATEAMKQLAVGYLTKAKWYKGQEMPRFEDHIANAVIVGGCDAILSACYMGMESATEEAFDWLKTVPKIVAASNNMVRFMNDIGSYEREQRTGQFPTTVDCYMLENGASKQESLNKLLEFAEDAWKTVNKEWVTNACAPKPLMKAALNYARCVHVTYGAGLDGFTDSEKGLGPYIAALFVDPIDI